MLCRWGWPARRCKASTRGHGAAWQGLLSKDAHCKSQAGTSSSARSKAMAVVNPAACRSPIPQGAHRWMCRQISAQRKEGFLCDWQSLMITVRSSSTLAAASSSRSTKWQMAPSNRRMCWRTTAKATAHSSRSCSRNMSMS